MKQDIPFWGELKDVETPSECIPCRLCGQKCMATEEVEDRDGRGKVIRISSLCDQSLDLWDKDDTRTEFNLPKDAVKEWNKMNSIRIKTR